MFPLHIQDDELKWKISLGYDLPADLFLLYINGKSFHQMPTQAELNPEGPQNILTGAIMLNDVAVVDGWTQFNAYSMEQWHSEIDKLPIINLYIGYN